MQVILTHGGPIVAALLQGLHDSSPGVACTACACTTSFAALGGPGIAPVAQLLLDALKPLVKQRQQVVRSLLGGLLFGLAWMEGRLSRHVGSDSRPASSTLLVPQMCCMVHR